MPDAPMDAVARRNFVKAVAGSVLVLRPETAFGSQANSTVEIGGPATYAMVLAAGREAVAARHPVDDRLRFLAPFDLSLIHI